MQSILKGNKTNSRGVEATFPQNEWWGKEKVTFLLKSERRERSIHAKNQEEEHVGRGTERNSVQREVKRGE